MDSVEYNIKDVVHLYKKYKKDAAKWRRPFLR